jgi:penicillin amidase
MRKVVVRGALTLVVAASAAAAALGVYLYRALHASLPQLDGTVSTPGLVSSVRIERDAAGTPTIHAGNRWDRAYAIGYLHGQDRFFQMDVLRRAAAGELSELFGAAAVDLDKRNRVHQFRERAKTVVQAASEEDQAILDKYAAGVNAGRSRVGGRPFEYGLILGLDPRPWSPEDTVLVLFAMYLDLQGSEQRKEQTRHTAYETLPRALADFLCPKGCEEWDAPIVGEPLPTPEVPPPEAVNLRIDQGGAWKPIPDRSTPDDHDGVKPGSNNWAVAGAHTKHGGAIVANDMHLGLRAPNIWYRASFAIPAREVGTDADMKATGVTLPGAPSLVVGSNGHVAWGFTNSEGDWSDLVVVEVDPEDPERYRTPEGMKPFEVESETIQVRGGSPETVRVKKTVWGPVVGEDVRGRPLALRWVAHDADGVNLRSARAIEQINLEDAMSHAALCGNPAQNFTVVDRSGRIGWTIMGRIPKRKGNDGWLPSSWADGSNGWTGYFEPAEYPRVVNPESGRIWTANARVVGGEMLAKVGHGGYDLGARQKQIRDDLFALEKADEKDMLAVALDDRALFWAPWQALLLETLDEEAVHESSLRKEARGYVANWGGRAAVDSVGFRIVRDFQLEVKGRVLEWLTHPCRAADPNFRCADLPRSVEGSIGRIVFSSNRPMHLLDARYSSWEDFFLVSLDRVLARAAAGGAPLSEYTWGSYNTLAIEHPLSASLRASLGDFVVDSVLALDMPRQAASGGSRNMPKIQRPRSGASQRMAVSPGREEAGYFHMPCGQSGQPKSPFYRAGHADWVEGRFSPFLPGPAVHTLTLQPKQGGP